MKKTVPQGVQTTVTESSDDDDATAITGEGYPSGVALTVQNIVMTAELGVAVDLNRLAMAILNIDVPPPEIRGLRRNARRGVLCDRRGRIRRVTVCREEKRGVLVVTADGRMTCQGFKDEAATKSMMRRGAGIVADLGYDGAQLGEVEIRNIVATAQVGFPIRLGELFRTHPEHFPRGYNPQRFLGLVYHMAHPEGKMLIHSTGKLVIPGHTRRDRIREVLERVYPVLLEFKGSE